MPTTAGGLEALLVVGRAEGVVGRAEEVADFGGGTVVAAADGRGCPAQAVTSASTTAIIPPAAIRLALLAAELTAWSLAAGWP